MKNPGSIKKLPLVVICGRTNVGKSTLFNCLTEKRQALISTLAGTTRDSNLGEVEWANSAFNLVDTAGIIDQRALSNKKITSDDIDSQTQRQARSYLDQADLILFLVDTKTGLLPEDKNLAIGLQKNPDYRRKTMVIANKTDSWKLAAETAQFNQLGLGEPFPISAASGLQTGDLLDLIVITIDKNKKYHKEAVEPGKSQITVCIVGKPNVGKSSLLNAILGYERVIVSPIPHTTREPQNTEIIYREQTITLIDTAGISKQGKNSVGLEKFGIQKSLHSLDRADIAILVMDISEPLTHQDAKLVQEIVERGKSLIFVGNKWDLVENRDTKKMTEIIYDKLPFASWAPLQLISAKTGEKVNKILDLVITIAAERSLELSDSQCDKFMKAVVKIHKPAKGKGTRAPHLYEFRQTKHNPPAFALRIGPNDDLHFSYVRFMTNRLRERHGFTGTPLSIRVTKDKKSHTTYNE
jgi:GTP-binding protein